MSLRKVATGRVYDLELPAERAAFLEAALKESIAIQVRENRIARGWTQAELAKRCGTKQSAIARVESGGYLQTLSTLKKIAKAFDCALIVQFCAWSEFFRVMVTPIAASFEVEHAILENQ